MKIEGIDHVSIAVRDLESAERLWERIFGKKAESHSVAGGTKHARFFLDNIAFELLESVDPDGEIGKFVQKRGEGVYFVCFKVDDADDVAAHLNSIGLKAFKFGDTERYFVHPKGMNGVLAELTEGDQREATET